jgi:hypothetical protein
VESSPSPLPIAVRAYAPRAAALPAPAADEDTEGTEVRGDEPELVVVFDCETATDTGQQLTFGSWRYYHATWDQHGSPTLSCREEGLIYDDDLPDRNPTGYATLEAYVRDNPPDVDRSAPAASWHLRLYSRSTFAEELLHRVGFEHQALIVGFNLPFDLSRLVYKRVEQTRNRHPEQRQDPFEGGFSLPIIRGRSKKTGTWYDDSRYRPRIAVKTIDSKRHLIGFRHPEHADAVEAHPEREFYGHFLDLRTLAFALTNQGYSLARACADFDVPHPKQEAERHGVIDPDYITYNRADVRATAELYERLIGEYARHPISLSPTKAYSPASIGKAYLAAMGIKAPLVRQPDFPEEVLGYATSAYFGGRAECRIRRQAVPVRYCDFLSMYPTVNSLMDLWSMVTCERIETPGTTEDARRLIDEITLDDCFNPARWRGFSVLAEVEPVGDVLPVRARYQPGGGWQIGINPLTSPIPLWYALPDIIAAKLLHPGQKPPKIVRAIGLRPVGKQASITRRIMLRGETAVDPAREDFFRRVIELRKAIARDRTDAATSSPLEDFLKVLANASSYGIYAEMVRHELADHRTEDVTVRRIDGTTFTLPVSAPEDPGAWFFAPMAALITSAARLMLALAERAVTDAGGTYAFCDTDSIAIAATENPATTSTRGVPLISWSTVEEIRERFAQLNPYDRAIVPGSILELERENSVDGTPEELLCHAISAKRYALYRTHHLKPILRPKTEKWSEHGLGHLLNPTDPESSDCDWIRQTWLAILQNDATQPTWGNRPGLSRIAISTPHSLRPFRAYNQDAPLLGQVKPFNFLLSAQVAPLAHPEGYDPSRFHLIAPYERDPTKWLDLDWQDRYSRDHFHITTDDDDPDPDPIRIRTYADTLTRYRVHPEPKSLAPDGSPCRQTTIGLLQRRPVTVESLTYIGKEANDIDDIQAGIGTPEEETLNTYDDSEPNSWPTIWQPRLAKIPARVIVAEFPKHSHGRTISLSQVKALRAGHSTPHPRNRAVLLNLIRASPETG